MSSAPLTTGDWVSVGVALVGLFGLLLVRDTRYGAPTSILEHRATSFTVLILEIAARLVLFVLAACAVLVPVELLLALSLVLGPPEQPQILSRLQQVGLFLIFLPFLAVSCSRLLYRRAVVWQRQVRRWGLLHSGLPTPLLKLMDVLVDLYLRAARRLILYSARNLREPGQPLTPALVFGHFYGLAFAAAVLFSLLIIPAALAYALPSILPLSFTEESLSEAGLEPKLFLGALAVALAAFVELLQWVSERTSNRPVAAFAYLSALSAVVGLAMHLPESIDDDLGLSRAAISNQPLSSVLFGAGVGFVLAALWHCGIAALAIVARLTEPASIAPGEMEEPMELWTKRLENTYGQVVVDILSGDVTLERWLFDVPRLEGSVPDLAEHLRQLVSQDCPPATECTINWTWERAFTVGVPGYAESRRAAPSWRLVLTVECSSVPNSLYGLIETDLIGRVPKRWRKVKWNDADVVGIISGQTPGVFTSWERVDTTKSDRRTWTWRLLLDQRHELRLQYDDTSGIRSARFYSPSAHEPDPIPPPG